VAGKPSLILIVTILLFCFLSARLDPREVKALNDYPVHNIDTGLNYATIQEAINANETLDGHTIFVDEGIYYENVVVNKSLSLAGGNRETTIVEGGKKGTAVNITANRVILTRFTVKNSGPHYPTSGICLDCANFTTVTDNIVKESTYGIELLSSNNSTVNANQIVDNQYHGIVLYKSHNNTIGQNNLTRNNSEAINLVLSDGNYVHDNNMANNAEAIWMDDSFFNIFSNNIILNCTVSFLHVVAAADSVGNSFIGNDINNFNRTQLGLVLYSCNETLIIGNNIKNCEYGLYLARSNGNRIYHNNLVNNIHQAYIFDTSLDNAWDNCFEGNYWSDYNGHDSDQDGIGETPYIIDADNTDNYPLMGIFYSFNTFTGHEVDLVSNSTILDFVSGYSMFLNGTRQLALYYNALGSKDTTGFCRIVIPRAFMDGPYVIFVNNKTLTPNEMPVLNITHAFLYFTYTHIGYVKIVPEFPSFLILPLFMTATLLAVIVYKRRKERT